MKNTLKFLGAMGLAFSLTSCGSTQEQCNEVAPNSRPVDGVCLDNNFKEVDEFRAFCAVRAQRAVKRPETWKYGTITQVWECGDKEGK